jgi:hypothetical protein
MRPPPYCDRRSASTTAEIIGLLYAVLLCSQRRLPNFGLTDRTDPATMMLARLTFERRDHLDAVLAQLLIEWIAVVCAIADQILRLGLDHVEVEAQLYQPNFVVIGGMRADRERRRNAAISGSALCCPLNILRQSRPSSLTWATAATDAEQRSCELCRVSAKAGWVFTPSRSWCADGPAEA